MEKEEVGMKQSSNENYKSHDNTRFEATRRKYRIEGKFMKQEEMFFVFYFRFRILIFYVSFISCVACNSVGYRQPLTHTKHLNSYSSGRNNIENIFSIGAIKFI